ncbi:armadillo-type protein [Mycena olivaceomarginata]|nr:armadillo-type protein [Mycena olivaceomarginata]
MESVVPQEITTELTQILSNLLLGDNEIRINAETAVNERLAHTPELYLLALAQFAISADTEVMRSFSLVLLRRLLFRTAPTSPTQSASSQSPLIGQQQQQAYQSQSLPRLTLYDQLSSQTLTTLERLLLHSLQQESSNLVRRKTVDTVSDLAGEGMRRGRPWHALQALAFNMTQAGQPGATGTLSTETVAAENLRESAYRVFAGCPNLVMDLQTDAVLGVFQRGLQDVESIDVKQAALLASVAYLNAAEPGQLSAIALVDASYTGDSPFHSPRSFPLLVRSLLPIPPAAHLYAAPRRKTGPSPYANLTAFLTTLTPLCSTHPSLFQPHLQALLSFFPSLILPSADPGPTPTVSRPFPTDGEGNTSDRQGAFVFPPPESPHASVPPASAGAGGSTGTTPTSATFDGASPAERDLDADERQTLRLAALEFMVSLSEARAGMVKRVDGWVGIMVRACLEGMGEFEEGDGLEGWLEEDPSANSAAEAESTPAMYEQSLDRLACAVGGRAVLPPAFQVMENELGKVVESARYPMFRDLHPRVRYAACQCVGQLCTDLEEIIQERYHQQLASNETCSCHNLEPIVERLLKLLDPTGDPAHVRRYVQEQAITTLAMVADASETTFAARSYYPSIMPLLMNVLRNAGWADLSETIAVGPEMFLPDAHTTSLAHYLIATWAKVCQAMGPEFEPYLPVVMLLYEEEDKVEERDGWETVSMDGQTLGIRTSAIEEKCQAFETLVIYCSTLGPRFAPYLSQTFEVALPSLRFYFHDGVREACAMLIPMLLASGKNSGTLTNQMVTATFLQIINGISTEHDASFLSSLYKCFNDSLRIIGGPSALSPEFQNGVIEATKRQLQALADKRRARKARPASDLEEDREDMALLEEIEDFALEDMAKMLTVFEANHPLLVAVSSVKDLGFNQYDSDEDGNDEG